MLTDAALKFGILKCRDLVQLYYGARMVTSIVEGVQAILAGRALLILGPDPRRIKYEIIVTSFGPNAFDFEMGSPTQDNIGNDQFYSIQAGSTLIVERDFLTDMDAVCLPVQFTCGGQSVTVSTRETFLTPIPVDEMP